MKISGLFLRALLLVGLFSLQPVLAQADPALKTAVVELLESYLKIGPDKEELGDGSALANWAVLKGVALPELQQQSSLRIGSWNAIWGPLTTLLGQRGFSELEALEVLTLFEETESEPARFVRLLGRQKLLDPKIPKERNRGRQLRESVGSARGELKALRANCRFEKGGWSYTGTVFLDPGSRIVRLALRGSQPCKITGSARSANLNLKGRLFEDTQSPSGLKVQVLDRQFKSQGCELNLKDRIDSVQRLSGGGEAKLSGNLDLRVRDETVTGRFQVDLVSKQAGVALLTGRAVYSLRGSVTRNGKLEVKLVPVSTSGSRVLRQMLESEGALSGELLNSVGKGTIKLPVLKDPLKWEDTRTGRKRRK